MPEQGKGKDKRPLKSRSSSKKRPRGNAASGSELIHPKHNKTTSKQQLRNYMYDPVAPGLNACHRVLNAMGSSANSKLQGKKAKAVFTTFEVRDYDEARIFRERGVDQCVPAFGLKDRTDYETKEVAKIFGTNATPWEDIWMPVDPTYVATRLDSCDATCDMESVSEATRSCTTAERCVRAPQD
jgi:hypothetical protein